MTQREQLKAAEEEERKNPGASEGLLRLLVERAPVAMGIFDRSGAIEYANPALRLHYGDELAQARDVREFVSLANPDRAKVEEALSYLSEKIFTAPQEEGEPEPFEGEVVTPAGTRRVLFRPVVVGSKVVGVLDDITAYRRAEELEAINRALRESEAKYRKLHDSLRDAYAAVDVDGRIVECNPAFEEMVGYSLDELRQMTYFDLTPEQWHAHEADSIKKQVIARGYSDIYQKEYRCKNGTIIPVELRSFLIQDDEGNPEGIWAIIRNISKRRRLEEELKKSKAHLEDVVNTRTLELRESMARYKTLFNMLADMILVISAEGRILEVNRAASIMLGYSQEELLAMHLAGFPCDLRPEQREQYLRDALAGRTVSMDCELRRKDGARLPAQVRAVPAQLEGSTVVIASFRDVSKSRQAMQALQESEDRYRHLAAASFEGIGVIVDGIILDANEQLASMLGYELAEVVGQPTLDFVAPASRAVVARHIQSGSEEPYELELLHRDGTTIPVQGQGRMTDWHGQPARVSVVRDLREAKRLEAELSAQQAKLAQAQKLALLSEVSAGILHQVAQPLSIIFNNVAAAMDAIDKCESCACPAGEPLLDLNGQLKTLRRTIINLRTLAHPKRSHQASADLNGIVEEAVEAARPAAERHEVRLETELQTGLPSVRADPVQLNQVFANLLRNAVDAVASCDPDRRTVTITTRADGPDGVEATIRDEGGGIAREALSRLFEPLFTTKPDGMGVGLALARTIVTAHGGTIEGFNNQDAPGASFRVVLPTGKEAE